MASAWAWSIGLVILGCDFLSLDLVGYRASFSYFFFAFAAFFTLWAEKREFGTRISLYRLHDALIFSPWKYLLLYFLWISVFSPFTADPFRSLLYSANGWFSLLAVGITAQFAFCDRSERGVMLRPDLLRIVFFAYSGTLLLLFAYSFARLLIGTISTSIVNDQINLFLYFLVGFPYLLWDALKDGRRMLPRAWNSIAIVMGIIHLFLFASRYFKFSVVLCFLVIFSLFLYKKIRMQRAVVLVGTLAVAALIGFAILFTMAPLSIGKTSELFQTNLALQTKDSFSLAFQILKKTHFMGEGMGLVPLRGLFKVLAEAGIVGFVLYLGFFGNILWDLYRVRKSARVVVSNISFVSVAFFLVLWVHYFENPYGVYVWAWYSIWALFASTPKKKGK